MNLMGMGQADGAEEEAAAAMEALMGPEKEAKDARFRDARKKFHRGQGSRNSV